MDKIAVISDVHGNIPALETVLADIKGRGIDLIYNLGDLVGKGPNSDVAVDMCREVCQVIVRGNWDDAAAKPDDGTFGDWYRAQLGEARREYLRNLPNVHDFCMSGKQIRLYHASQQSEHYRVHPWKPQEVLRAMFDNTEFTGFEHPAPDVAGYGDIHGAYMLPVDVANDQCKILFNAGSVGNPLDWPLATYVIMTGNLDSDKPGFFSIDFVRLEYDIEKTLEQGRAVGLPDLDYYSVELRQAIYRGQQKKRE